MSHGNLPISYVHFYHPTSFSLHQGYACSTRNKTLSNVLRITFSLAMKIVRLQVYVQHHMRVTCYTSNQPRLTNF